MVTSPFSPKGRQATPLENVGISCMTGGTQMALTNSVDTLRIRWQVTPRAQSGTSFWGFARTIVRKEGLWRGLWAPALATNSIVCGIMVGVRLGLYPSVRDALQKLERGWLQPHNGGFREPLSTSGGGKMVKGKAMAATGKSTTTMLLSGVVTGACAYMVGCPMFLAKNRLQAEAGLICADTGTYLTGARAGLKPSYRHGLDALMQIGRHEGLRGLWRGAPVLVLRGSTLSSSQLMGYDFTKTTCKHHGWLDEGAALHACASLVGALTLTVFTTPLDVVLTRYQTASTIGSGAGGGGRVLGVVRDIHAEGGVLGFYRGSMALFSVLWLYCDAPCVAADVRDLREPAQTLRLRVHELKGVLALVRMVLGQGKAKKQEDESTNSCDAEADAQKHHIQTTQAMD